MDLSDFSSWSKTPSFDYELRSDPIPEERRQIERTYEEYSERIKESLCQLVEEPSQEVNDEVKDTARRTSEESSNDNTSQHNTYAEDGEMDEPYNYRHRFLSYQMTKLSLIETISEMKNRIIIIHKEVLVLKMDGSNDCILNSSRLKVLERVINELDSTVECSTVVQIFAESVLQERKEEKDLVEMSLRLIRMLDTVSKSCLKRCDLMVQVSRNEDMANIQSADRSITEWLLRNPRISDFVQNYYETMRSNRSLFGIFVATIAAVIIAFAVKNPSRSSLVAFFGSMIGLITVDRNCYSLGRDVSVLKNPQLVFQLKKMKEIISQSSDMETSETMLQLSKALHLSHQVGLKYDYFFEKSQQECAICYNPLLTGSIGRPNTCEGHWFHYKELQEWSMKDKTCPYCRNQFDYIEEIRGDDS